MKKLIISTLFIMQVLFVFAQTLPSGVTGTVVDSRSQQPMSNVVVSVQNTNFTVMTDAGGKFLFDKLPVGNHLLQVRNIGFRDQMFPIDVFEGKITDLGLLPLEYDFTSEQQLSLITITENDLGDDNSGSESTAGLLQATRDVFNQVAAFNFGQARFRIRGLDNEFGKTMINGVVMNKIYDGRPQWGNWGGLNDATRNQEFSNGLAPSDYTFGGILGTQVINTRASAYRPGSRISFAGTNTNYNWRAMGTHASGMNQDGWAYVISAGRRWAVEGYFDGTDYSANSLFASVEKRINDNHSLNFTSIYAENNRGKNSPNSDEITKLTSIKYNSYWGWQDGKKRNSRDKDVEEPLMILGHYWKMNDKTNLNTNISFQTGKIGNSRLDFNGANNPDPTYYRNLPSYYTTQFDEFNDYVGNTPQNQANAAGVRDYFLANSQINWDEIYRANVENANNFGGETLVVLYEDRTDDTQVSANSYLDSQLSDNILLNAGVNYRKLRSKNFAIVTDLLGGQYYNDVDQFFTGDQSQPDLLNPNRTVGEGDKFGYNYILHADVVDAFTQFKFTYDKFDFFLAQTFSKSMYQREGIFQNGIYPNSSLGKSRMVTFDNFGFKGGLTYKLTGQHYFDFNGLYMTNAPTLRNTFPNVRLNNAVVQDITSEAIVSADASYIIRTPKLKARITGYYSKISNTTDIGFFYAEGVGIIGTDGELLNTTGDAFVAEIVTGANKKNIGGEFGFEYALTSTLKVNGAAAYGQFTYDNNPNVKLNVDNAQRIVDFGQSTMKNYHQPGTPQQAYSLGLEYRSPKFWWVGVNGNYLADNYLDISPLLRTNNFYNNPIEIQPGLPFFGATEEEGRKLLRQEKFDPIELFNLVGGKSWRISGKTVGFFASVNNVFDKTYKTGGFEQARNANFQEIQQDLAGPDRSFGPKYFYGYGRTYFVNLYVNF